MAEEISRGLFRIPVPLADSPLHAVNVYAVQGPEGLLLIDCGWETPEALAALRFELEPLGGIRAIGEILVTHIHPDHFGLAQHLSEVSGARVSMHQLEASLIETRYRDIDGLVTSMDAWLRRHGVPDDELDAMLDGSLRMIERVGTRRPEVALQGGEIITWGEYRFEVLWTPGHSAGLVSLYDRDRQLLLSSDHVLPRVSPHVGLHTQSLGNPLGDYLRSLEKVRVLPVRQVLPGHGEPFGDLPARLDQLVEHHENRLSAVIEAVEHGYHSAFEVAEQLPWRGAADGWNTLEPFQRRMAVTEIIAHLEHLRVRHEVQASAGQGQVRYATAVEEIAVE